jgi:hypothetical protein
VSSVFPDAVPAKIRRRPEKFALRLSRDPAHQTVTENLDPAQALGQALEEGRPIGWMQRRGGAVDSIQLFVAEREHEWEIPLARMD